MRAQGPSGINELELKVRKKMVLELVERTMLLRNNEMEFNRRIKMVLELVERTMLSHIFTLKSAFHERIHLHS
jgi:hypothetical protein